MDEVTLLGKCRACGIKTQKELQHNIFTKENLQQCFRDITALEIHENDGLPGCLCDDCHSRLIDASNFRQMCASSAQTFQQILAGEIDSDYEEKYQPLLSDCTPDDTELIVPDKDLFEEKFNPIQLPVPGDTGKKAKALRPNKKSLNKKSRQKSENLPEVPGEFKCNDCGKVYTKKSSLKTHRNTMHKDFQIVTCSICNRSFQRLELLRNHMVRVHNANGMHKCKECSRVFRTHEGLTKHMIEWHDPLNPKEKRNYICEVCGKAFGSTTHLQEHINTHSGVKPHKCTICFRDYLTKQQLKVHTKRCHDGIKNHKCIQCGSQKATLRELELHMNQHRGERIPCDMCNKTFISIVNLNGHMKIVHQGIKAYKCDVCGQKFSQARTLKHHRMIHTGEKPHACDECGKRFIQLSGLYSHKRTHTKAKLKCELK